MSDAVPARLAAALADRYALERELGEGGMATVYLARDLRHERKVALKVLRPDLAAVVGAERFLAEIRTTANLQHPHILPLHDSGEAGGFLFYVMPYVEGETLRDRLDREKQLPIPDALRIARETASALDYAHRRGVIHRDVKPANILLHEGQALVADFGIALAVQAAGEQRMTQTGLSLGTPHYMSPEQAMGEKTLDARTDVYALGAVTYEMLTGEPPFGGATVQAILAKVLTERPVPPSRVRDTVPPHVEAAVLTSLAKLPADRFATAAAFADALERPGAAAPAGFPTSAVPAPRTLRWKAATMALAGVSGALAVALGVALASSPSEAGGRSGPILRFEVPVPDSLGVESVALRPDGTGLLIRTRAGAFLYDFADMRLAAVDLPGVRLPIYTRFSPDGAGLEFLERGVLKTTPLQGGPTRTLADSARDWAHDEVGVLYVSQRIGGISRIARIRQGDGAVEELAVAPDASTEFGSIVPLPGGRAVLFGTTRAAPRRDEVAILDLGTKEVRTLPGDVTASASPFAWVPTGHVLLVAGDGVWALPFDAERLEATGPRIKIAPLPLGLSFEAGMFAYNLTTQNGPAIVDREGRRRSLEGVPPDVYSFDVSASPDGRTLAVYSMELGPDRYDIWTYRLPAGPMLRLTSDPAAANRLPRWSADGESVLFVSTRGGHSSVYAAARDGSREEELLRLPGNVTAASPAPDGRRLVVHEEGRGLVLADLRGTDSARVLVEERLAPEHPAVSPDGRWLAYTALEVGRREVFVRTLEGEEARWQVSWAGGAQPAWSRSGGSLFFMNADSLYEAIVSDTSGGFRTDAVRTLFRLGNVGGDWTYGFDVLPGDTAFAMLAALPWQRERIVVMASFLEELEALSGTAPAQRRR